MSTTSSGPTTTQRERYFLEFCPPTDGLEAQLSMEELALIAGSTSSSRRQLFSAGRICAQRALARALNSKEFSPILRGESGEPSFPSGTRGSISHCDSMACAVVSVDQVSLGIGIDMEAASRKMNPRVIERISTQAERECYQSLTGALLQQTWLKIFCGKEAIFKACFPYLKRECSFGDVSIILSSSEDIRVHPSEKMREKLNSTIAGPWQLQLRFQTHKGCEVALAEIRKIWPV